MADFLDCGFYHAIMKADWRISIKDYRQNENLKAPRVA